MRDYLEPACEGGLTIAHRSGPEHMERCTKCGMSVRRDLTEHPFFGFKAACSTKRKETAK